MPSNPSGRKYIQTEKSHRNIPKICFSTGAVQKSQLSLNNIGWNTFVSSLWVNLVHSLQIRKKLLKKCLQVILKIRSKNVYVLFFLIKLSKDFLKCIICSLDDKWCNKWSVKLYSNCKNIMKKTAGGSKTPVFEWHVPEDPHCV